MQEQNAGDSVATVVVWKERVQHVRTSRWKEDHRETYVGIGAGASDTLPVRAFSPNLFKSDGAWGRSGAPRFETVSSTITSIFKGRPKASREIGGMTLSSAEKEGIHKHALPSTIFPSYFVRATAASAGR